MYNMLSRGLPFAGSWKFDSPYLFVKSLGSRGTQGHSEQLAKGGRLVSCIVVNLNGKCVFGCACSNIRGNRNPFINMNDLVFLFDLALRFDDVGFIASALWGFSNLWGEGRAADGEDMLEVF